jgi:hypothetical protein
MERKFLTPSEQREAYSVWLLFEPIIGSELATEEERR